MYVKVCTLYALMVKNVILVLSNLIIPLKMLTINYYFYTKY